MKPRVSRTAAVTLALFALLAPTVRAQTPAPQDPAAQYPAAYPPPPSQPAAPPLYAPPQLDQLLAPVALYPDELLGQVLMAATYPLEVVQADRWVKDPSNAGLKGDALAAALEPLDWEPSVKSLVPFPQILAMMDSRLDWMQKLGDAFLAQQQDVMDAVQRLRRQAEAAGSLRSTAQETVQPQGQTIVIEPANPQVVYVPVYNPVQVYGSWAYPDYPPVYIPPPPGFYAGPALVAGIGFSIGFGIVPALWGWDHCDWREHRMHVDPDRVNVINNYFITHDARPRFEQRDWEHDPYHRRGVVYRDAPTRERFRNVPASAPAARAAFRGFAPNVAPAAAPGAAAFQGANRPAGGPPPGAGPAGRPGEENHRAPENRAQFAQRPPTPAPQAVAPVPQARAPQPQFAQRPPTPAPQTVAPVPQARAPQPQFAQRPPTPVPQTVAPVPQARAPQPQFAQRPAVVPPAFQNVARGPDVRAQAERGRASVQAAVAARPSPPPPRPAPVQARPAAAPAPAAHPPAKDPRRDH